MRQGVKFNLASLFEFVKKHGNDLESSHYQIAVREKGLGVEIVLKYIHGPSPHGEAAIADIGL